METKPAPFIGLGFVAGETECCLGISQQEGISRIVRLVAGGAGFFHFDWMGALFVSKRSLIMTGKAKRISLLLEQEMLPTVMTVMAGKALPFAGRFVGAASNFWGRVTCAIHHREGLVICFLRGFMAMATQADLLLRDIQ